MARVLVVDDDRAIAEMVARVVRFCGHEPVVCLDSREVLLHHRIGYGAAVVDYLMPGFNGLELLASIEESAPKTRRILLTAAPDERPVQEALLAGTVQQVISKPPSIHDFEVALAWM